MVHYTYYTILYYTIPYRLRQNEKPPQPVIRGGYAPHAGDRPICVFMPFKFV